MMKQVDALEKLREYMNESVDDKPTNREIINESDFYADVNQSLVYVALRGNIVHTRVIKPTYARELAITTGWFSGVVSINPLEEDCFTKVDGLRLPISPDSEIVKYLGIAGYCAYRNYSFNRFLVIYYLVSGDRSYEQAGISRSTLYRTKYNPSTYLNRKLDKIKTDNIKNFKAIYDKMIS